MSLQQGMPVAEINRLLDEEREKFNNEIFPVAIPKCFMDLYKKALFARSGADAGYSSATVKKLVAKKVNSLNNFEVGYMLNFISNAPNHLMYENLEEALAFNEQLDNVRISHKMIYNRFEDTMRTKTAILKGEKPPKTTNLISV